MVKQVIVIRKDLNMRKGKMCAQAAHASMKVLLDTIKSYNGIRVLFVHGECEKEFKEWLDGKFTKIVVGCGSESELLSFELLAKEKGIPNALIQDAGATEFHGVPTYTALALGPARAGKIDEITGHLKLL